MAVGSRVLGEALPGQERGRRLRRRPAWSVAVAASVLTHAMICAWLLLSARPAVHPQQDETIQVSLIRSPAPAARRPQRRSRPPQAPRASLRQPRDTLSPPAASVPAPAPAAAVGPSPEAVTALQGIARALDCTAPDVRLTAEQRARCPHVAPDASAPTFVFRGRAVEAWDREMAERRAPPKTGFQACPTDMPGSNLGHSCLMTRKDPGH